MEPHPLFKAFIGAAHEYRAKRLEAQELQQRLFSRAD
jgi:hypothetical protein